MRVELKAIEFNYAEDLSQTGAFYIRRNETQVVRIPEWQPDIGSCHESSPVAYSMGNLPAMMTIRASFKAEGGPQSVLVRAKAESSGHVLGDVQQESIPGAGESGFIRFNLPAARALVLRNGIGVFDIDWRWQFSDHPASWTPFQLTRHRVYVVLARPTCPWQPEDKDSSNTHQPWTEVLDRACQWAAGIKSDPDEAARLVNERVSALGNELVEYSSGAAYAHATFKCTEFLELLRSGAGERTLNCDDCATIVSTFANIVGSDLWQSSMGRDFNTNQVIQIGDDGWTHPHFIHHSVAWKNECQVNDILYDAYLRVDGQGLPNELPRMPLQPGGIIFGRSQDLAYSFRLVHVDSTCGPTPDGLYPRQRRLIGRSYFGSAKLPNEEARNMLKEVYEFGTWPPVQSTERSEQLDSLSLERLMHDGVFAKWQLVSFEMVSDDQFTNVFEVLLKDEQSRLLSLKVYECRKQAEVNDSLLQILGVFNQKLNRIEGVGEIAFVDRHNEDAVAIVFRRGLFLGMVTSSGKQKMDILEFAGALDTFLAAQTFLRSGSTIMENTMAHRLADMWKNFGFNPTVNPPTIQRQGDFDLRTLDENGILERGYAGEPVRTIRGKVNEIGNITYVRFERTDTGANGAFFEGFLIIDTPLRTTIVGQFVTPNALVTNGQTEEPWVITKP